MTSRHLSVLAIALSVPLAARAAAPSLSQEDLKLIRSRIVGSVVPPDGPDAEQLIGIGRKVAATQQADGSWPDVNYASQDRSIWGARLHLDRLLALARADFLLHRQGKTDADLTAKTVAALNCWLTRDPQNPNWWWNEIGGPLMLGESCLLMGDGLPAESLPRVIAVMRRSKWEKWTGQNVVWGTDNQVMRGILAGEPDTVAAGYARMYDEIVVTEREGIQEDGSFHQHGIQFYSGGYGQDFAQDVGRYVAFAWGTPAQIPEGKLKIFSRFLLDGEAWMTWGPIFDYSAVGREISRPGKLATTPLWTDTPMYPIGRAYTLGNSMRVFATFPTPRQAEVQSWADSLNSASDASAPAVNLGHKHFYRSDYTAHRRAGYFFSVKMFSTRIQNSESGNGEGKLSHHLGDGNYFLYQSGREYRDIFGAWDWQKLPGTTAEQGTQASPHEALNAVCGSGGTGVRGKTSFVGGVSDGTYGATTLQLQRLKLSARKSYFFFDDEVVCLGSGITCSSDNDTLTVLNQCKLEGEVARADDLSWVNHANVGYVIAGGQRASLSTAPGTGRWSDSNESESKEPTALPLFLLTLDHGRRASEASYAYSVLPGLSAEQTKARAARPQVEVLANTAEVQAVHNKALDITMAVFHAAGKVGAVEVDAPCIVMVREGKLSACDPTNGSPRLAVKVNGQPYTLDLAGGRTSTVPIH